jgi:hypothetical protein
MRPFQCSYAAAMVSAGRVQVQGLERLIQATAEPKPDDASNWTMDGRNFSQVQFGCTAAVLCLTLRSTITVHSMPVHRTVRSYAPRHATHTSHPPPPPPLPIHPLRRTLSCIG